MKISQRGIDLIKQFEGCKLTAYEDAVGVWTIGYGSTLGVKMGDRVTQHQAEVLLLADLLRFETGVTNLLKVPVKQSQFDALVSFAFNVGLRAFENSTLLRLLNTGQHEKAADQFRRWNRAGRMELLGLTRRRLAEAQLYLEDL